MVPEAEFSSYYGRPVVKEPTWAPLDIAGYLFLGGLAGASSTLAAGAQLSGRPGLARPLKLGAVGAISLSLVALVHDLGRPARFLNMLRVFKPTSPMSVGVWILSAYAPAAGAAALGELVPSGRLSHSASSGPQAPHCSAQRLRPIRACSSPTQLRRRGTKDIARCRSCSSARRRAPPRVSGC